MKHDEIQDLGDTSDSRFTVAQLAVLSEFQSAKPAPESFDPYAALQRVLELADVVQRGELGDIDAFFVARLIRVAVHNSAAVLTVEGAVL